MRRDFPPTQRPPSGREAAARLALQRAIEAMGAGDLDGALQTLQSDAVALKTPVGQNILGDIHLKRENPREALKAFDAALKLAPQMPEAHCNRAAALQELGRFPDALAAADAAIRYRPAYATAFYNRGNALKALRRLDDAGEAYSKAITLRTPFAEALLNRGLARVDQGKWLDALADFNKALVARPHYAAAHVGRAVAYRGMHDMASAFAAIDAATAIEPGNIDAALAKIEVLITADRDEDALAVADGIIARAPDNAKAHTARARALTGLNRAGEALAAAEISLRLAPKEPGPLVARASALNALGRREESLASLEAAEKLGASGASYYNARAVVVGALGDPAEALQWFDRAIALEPNNADIRYNHAFALLALGRFKEGWVEYEWRLRKRDAGRPDMHALAPQWRGEDLTGKKLLIYAEQGHGDSLQFTRYVPMVAARGGAITLSVQEGIRRLYEANFPDLDVTAELAMRSGYDYQVSLMSLPFVFGTTLDTVPNGVPYLRPDPERVARWRTRLGEEGFKVGIVWQGNPKYGGDKERSFGVTEFSPLAEVPGVRLISLQWTGGAEQLNRLDNGMAIETLGEEVVNNPDGFREVAAVMANLDLLVLSDTGPAHLAGALALPVWVALARKPDWRWMREGTTTPWYPTMRLFRQRTRGDWAGVFGEIREALRERVAEKAASRDQ